MSFLNKTVKSVDVEVDGVFKGKQNVGQRLSEVSTETLTYKRFSMWPVPHHADPISAGSRILQRRYLLHLQQQQYGEVK